MLQGQNEYVVSSLQQDKSFQVRSLVSALTLFGRSNLVLYSGHENVAAVALWRPYMCI